MATRAKRENERDQDRPAYHYPTTRTFGGEKKKKKIRSILKITLWCYQHITFSQRREKSNQKQKKAKERGEGEGKGRMIDLFADKEPERMWAKRERNKKNKGKEMQHQRKIKDNSDE